jgi:AAHS family 3-hydroxyphenylpropionic acid transporter
MAQLTIGTAPPAKASPIIGLCVAVGMCQGFVLLAPSVSAVQLREAFGLTPAQLGSFFSAGTLGLLLGASAGGTLSDRIGRKPVLLLSVLCFAVGSLANGFAFDLSSLFLFRLLTGMGMGGTFANLITIGSENAPPERRSRTVSLIIGSMPFGSAMACALAGWQPAMDDWRLLYVIGGIAPLLLLPSLILLLPTMRPPARISAAEKGAIAECLAPDRRAATLTLWIAMLTVMISVYLLSSWLPTLLQGRGMSHRESVMVQVIMNLGGMTGAAMAGWVLDRPLRQRLWGIGVLNLTYLASILLLAVAPTDLTFTLGLGGLVGAAMTAVCGVLYALAPALYPPHIRGTGIGLGLSAGKIGSIIGPLFAGILLGQGYAEAFVLLSMLPLTAIAAIGAIAIAWIANCGHLDAETRR